MAFELSRRVMLRRVSLFTALTLTARASAQILTPDGVRPNRVGTAAFMERAFELRRRAMERGDQPYGAVVVKEGTIVGEGMSAVVTDHDPTAHAEMQAIRDAARRLGTNDLSACEMYGTSRACPMCEAAAYWARISRMYHGASVADAGPPRLP